jgi:tRNA (adenine22-N1)-methyltransferase
LVGLPKDINQVLIAGMGGEEIVKILKDSFIPQSFVFQPMKNAQQLRSYLLENGCQITADDIFKDGKYYFIIKGNNCGNAQKYTSAQIQFGKDSLNNPLLSEYLNEEIKKNENYLLNDMSEENRRIVEKRIDYLKGVAKGEIR